MTALANITFQKPGRKPAGTLVVLAGEDLQLGPLAKALGIDKLVARAAAAAASFKGKAMATLDLYAPAGTDLDRLIVLGCGKPGELKDHDWLRLGGAAMGALRKGKSATVLLERPDGRRARRRSGRRFRPRRRSYAPTHSTSTRRTSPKTATAKGRDRRITLWLADPPAPKVAWARARAVAEGVLLARDLVNEPANVLGPVEFAAAPKELKGSASR